MLQLGLSDIAFPKQHLGFQGLGISHLGLLETMLPGLGLGLIKVGLPLLGLNL